MNYTIRKCTVDDLPILRNIAEQTYDETFRPFNTPENMEAYLTSAFEISKVQKELMDKSSSFYFLMVENELAGYLKVNDCEAQTEINDPQALEIERIYILKNFHSKGLGRLLLDYAMQLARELNKSYVWLGVWEKNEKAVAFYERNGFYRVSQHSFFMGDDEQIDYIMRKELS